MSEHLSGLRLRGGDSQQRMQADSRQHSQGYTQEQPFSFSGSGSEYFRIWIVNLLLSIITLGIYSAWAKVRRTTYFYNSTSVAGSSFDYHGNPLSILKGRFVALMLILLYQLAHRTSGIASLIILTVVGLAMPWLIWKSLQFKLYNSSYRGIRFNFRGSLKQAYTVYLLWPLVSMASLFMASPLAHQRLKKFQHEESRFGRSHFSFNATVGSFYKRYLIFSLIWLAGIVVIAVLFGGSIFAMASKAGDRTQLSAASAFAGVVLIIGIYAWTFLLFPVASMLIQNLIWNHTQLGSHQFRCQMRWGRVVYLSATNLIGVICTLGLFMPFAHVRWLRYRVESMTLLENDSLEDFVADEKAQVSATGEGMADLLDFDLSL